MLSAAAAFAWEFRQRLRWGLIALGVYFVLLAVFQFLVLGPRASHDAEQPVRFAFTVAVPLSFAFMYLLAVFSYGLAGDLAARHSLYPARLFTLPISTPALAGWPMLYGAAALVLLWYGAAFIALRPSGVPTPLVWPAVFLAAFMAWMQVFTWMGYGLPGLRIVAAVLCLTTIDAVVFTAIEYEVREWVMVAVLAPLIPLAYVAAWVAVGRARRGEVPDWRGVFAAGGRVADLRRRAGAPFRSAARAQAWLEWREHGWPLPVWTAIVLPFELLLLYAAGDEPAALTILTLLGMLVTPPFLAAFVAVTVGRSGTDAGRSYGLTPFVATRPLGTATLVAAKLKMALASTLLAWLVVLVAVAMGLTLAGSWPVVGDVAHRLTGFVGAPRAAVVVALGLLLLLAATWKQLVQGLALGLTGREGLIKSILLARLSLLILVGPAAHVLGESPGARVALFNAVPWIMAVLVGVKMCAAGWVAVRLARSRVIGERALLAGAAGWVAAVLALYGLFVWLIDTPLTGRHILALLAILAVPLARPAVVPLALAWNRHRGAPPAPTGAVRRPLVALALLGVPAALALALAVSFHVRNRSNGFFESSGEQREYLLHVPRSYDPTRPTPLVISLHGGAMWPAGQRDVSQWNTVADEHGFLVVYPSAIAGRGPRAWRTTAGGGLVRKDVRYIAELIDRLQASYNIDRDRIYADGLSNGGGMAFALSCTLSDRIAAIGLVASAHFLPWSWCEDRRPVPVIAFHGTDDRFTGYEGGRSPVAPGHVFPSIPEWTARWAVRNRCAATPTDSPVAADVTQRAYTACADGADVVLHTIHGGGHTWPGGGPQPKWFLGKTSRSIHASRLAWAFFQAHPLRRNSP